MYKQELNVLIDWVTITFPVDEDEADYIAEYGKSIQSLYRNKFFKFFRTLLNDVNYEEYTDGGKISHYDRMFIFDEFINFKYFGPLNAKDTPTHALELKGEGCRSVELLGMDWVLLLDYAYTNGLNVSTLDIACDIFTDKYFTIDNLIKKTNKGEYISTFKNYNIIHGKRNGTYSGSTIYFGNRSADHITIYDKQYERYYRGYEVDTNFWLRIEIRLKNKSKSFVAELINRGIDDFPLLYFEILKGLLQFKVKGKSIQKSLWKIWRPWERFIGDGKEVELINQAVLETSITRKKDWYLNSAAKTYMMIRACSTDEEFEEYQEEAKFKVSKLTNKDLVVINKERKLKGYEEFKNINQLKLYLINTPL